MEKTLLVFGAYGALGRGVVKTLVEKNYDKIFLFDADAEEKNVNNDHVINISTKDLSIEENVSNAFRKVPETGGKVFLFSTIGGYFDEGLKETSIDDWDKMFNMNLKANFLLAREYGKMFENNKGALCFTSAMTGFNPQPGKTAYGGSKCALNYLIETLASEFGEKNIGVCGIAPYMIDTPANREWGDESDYNSWQKPEEIGELIHFIFSSYHYLSGNIIKLQKRLR